jgi:hypothetical protein
VKLRLLLCLLAIVVLERTARLNAEESKVGSVAFVLDCSRSMGRPAEADGQDDADAGNEEPTTRLAAASGLLREMLQELAAEGNSQVSIWLYGHRLVWEQDTKHPDLLSQDTYLEATVGYEVLSGLLPGDDVELALPFRRFRPAEMQQLSVRLDALKPWGEKPLYLTLTRALDSIADQPAALPKNVIVLTDGGNEQWLARHKTPADRVKQVLKHNLVPIHFVYFGPAGAEAQHELRSLADASGGSLAQAHATTQLTVAQVLSNSRKAPVVNTVRTGDDEADGESVAPKTLVSSSGPRNVSGTVVFNGKPVTAATIALEGADVSPVKADRQGRFLIRDVPAGKTYQIRVTATAKNQIREKTVEVQVAAEQAEQPFLTIDVK